jgi:hypothetical protein
VSRNGLRSQFRDTFLSYSFRRALRAFFALAMLATISCTSSLQPQFSAQASSYDITAAKVPVHHDRSLGHTDISVLTYNVKGLPWPLRLDLPEPDPHTAMAQIGRHLAHLRANNTAPDVVLVQEGFTETAILIGKLGGYAFAVHGPTRDDARSAGNAAGDPKPADTSAFNNGEPILDSGLHVFSNYPISIVARRAFGKFACAGYDCLAAKGVLVLQIEIPGVPDPVIFMTVHMNANGASGARPEQALAAHQRQMDIFADTLQVDIDPGLPLVFGGDFNIKKAIGRRDYADRRLNGSGLEAVHVVCVRMPACQPRYPVAGDTHWLAPRDIQGYRDGRRVRLTPLASEELFSNASNGGRMSDHVGYMARYRLTWPVVVAGRER